MDHTTEQRAIVHFPSLVSRFSDGGSYPGCVIPDFLMHSHVVAMTPTRGLVSRFGSWGANLIRERFGPECRTVNDLAKVLDVIHGYDFKDPLPPRKSVSPR